MAAYRILGITNDVDSCDCCGRQDLKRVVILGVLDASGAVLSEVYYGTSCAARALGRTGRGANTRVESEALAAQGRRERATREIARLEGLLADEAALLDWSLQPGNNEAVVEVIRAKPQRRVAAAAVVIHRLIEHHRAA